MYASLLSRKKEAVVLQGARARKVFSVFETSAQLLTNCFDVFKVNIAILDQEQPSTSQFGEGSLGTFYHTHEALVQAICFSDNGGKAGSATGWLEFSLKTSVEGLTRQGIVFLPWWSIFVWKLYSKAESVPLTKERKWRRKHIRRSNFMYIPRHVNFLPGCIKTTRFSDPRWMAPIESESRHGSGEVMKNIARRSINR